MFFFFLSFFFLYISFSIIFGLALEDPVWLIGLANIDVWNHDNKNNNNNNNDNNDNDNDNYNNSLNVAYVESNLIC